MDNGNPQWRFVKTLTKIGTTGKTMHAAAEKQPRETVWDLIRGNEEMEKGLTLWQHGLDHSILSSKETMTISEW